MTTATTVPVAVSRPASQTVQYTRAFVGLFVRDLYVLRRELFPFVIRVCMNPLLFLFVFTYVIPHLSGPAAGANPTASMAGGGAAFSTVLLPGADGGGDHVQRDCGGGAARWHRTSASRARSTTA